MNKISIKFGKILRKMKKMRLRPISVFLFHQVSDAFDESTMYMMDWTEINQFKRNVRMLMKKYKFISLERAYFKMEKDVFRFSNYAVMTSDDGWASLKNVLPWLEEQGIPVALFLNPGYFDGRHFRDKDTEQYLLWEDIERIQVELPHVSFGMHGWEHTNSTNKSEQEFCDDVCRTVKSLKVYSNYIPFWAYTWGKHNDMNDRILKENSIIRVLIDGEKNTKDLSCIHRELIDGIVL